MSNTCELEDFVEFINCIYLICFVLLQYLIGEFNSPEFYKNLSKAVHVIFSFLVSLSLLFFFHLFLAVPIQHWGCQKI